MRCAAMGAQCSKLEPPAAQPAAAGAAGTAGVAGADPMAHYSPQAYADMHQGIAVWQAQLKSEEGQAALHDALDAADILLTSFRPAALAKLGLDWASLQQRHPRLSLVRIVGSAGALADVPGHDLTYQAEAGLVQGGAMPPSLFADMAGALMASEAVLKAWLLCQRSGHGSLQETGLAQAAQWLALPWHWGLTRPDGDVGGAHAGYRVYACADGSVAVAALEPHFRGPPVRRGVGEWRWQHRQHAQPRHACSPASLPGPLVLRRAGRPGRAARSAPAPSSRPTPGTASLVGGHLKAPPARNLQAAQVMAGRSMRARCGQ